MRELARAIAELYAAGLALPEVEPDEDLARPQVSVPGDITVGSADRYHEVFDPFVDDAPVAGSLRDDTEDIYRDVVGGLELVEQGRVEEAVWTWRFDQRVHWGDHAVDALRALQRLLGRDD